MGNLLVPCAGVLLSAVLGWGADSVSLAGTWSFRLDPQRAGEAGNWQNHTLPDSIRLPGSTDEAGYGEATVGSDHGHLTRVRRYIGAAWYQRDYEVPQSWRTREVELLLERVLWKSTVWVDGKLAGSHDSLGVPHVHHLGTLAPGRHRLTVRVDNSMIHPIGDKGHAYTEHTQTIWNGITGELRLRSRARVQLGLVRIFPSADLRRVEIETQILNRGGGPARGRLRFTVRERGSGREAGSGSFSFAVQGTEAVEKQAVILNRAPKRWDEFEPNLYTLQVRLDSEAGPDSGEYVFGFRDAGRQGRHISINGRPVFLRGNLDCVHFPRTGYPPTDVESWRRLFRIYKEHGMNHVRFHSWCPPAAAFTAADELGLYLQAEVLWIDTWMGKDNPGQPDRDTPGRPQGVGKGDRTIDDYVRAEMRRMLDAYGNHPSFLLFCIGNELGSSDFQVMGQWIREEKLRDPRRLYAASTARRITAFDDYSATHAIPDIGRARGRIEPRTDWDYQDTYGKAGVPIIAHEIGQWPVYPAWSEIEKYTGVVRARNLEQFREQARANGIGLMDRELRAASGASGLLLYKYEIESFLRTPGCAGVQLLSMQDFSGQGEALVGWLDSFYESKGIASPARFRRHFNSTTPLLRTPKFVWTNAERLTAAAEAAHYGPRTLESARSQWVLRDMAGAVVEQGEFPRTGLPVGRVTPLGAISLSLARFERPVQLNLEVLIAGTEFANDWNLWVFPARAPAGDAPGVLVTAELPAALAALARGGKVLLIANLLGGKGTATPAAWMPLYWSASFFPDQNRSTLGAWIQKDHPALSGFPTQSHLDWQWHSLAQNARAFVLDKFPPGYRPIVQPVSDFHFNHKLGSLFELRTPQGGKLLVSGYNLSGAAAIPEAAALRRSLLAYLASERFSPSQEVAEGALRDLFAGAAELTSRP